jgi:hypothetical protein
MGRLINEHKNTRHPAIVNTSNERSFFYSIDQQHHLTVPLLLFLEERHNVLTSVFLGVRIDRVQLVYAF